MTDLYTQLADPNSAIMNGNATGQLEQNQIPIVVMLCPEGTHRAEGSSVCEACHGGYEPNTEQNKCVKCVESRGGNGFSGLEYYSAGNECKLCPPGSVPQNDEFGNKVDCVTCADGMYSAGGADRCDPCPVRQQPNTDKSACICAPDMYNATMGRILCFAETGSYDEEDFPFPDKNAATTDGCLPCDDNCLGCASGVPLMLPGYAMSVTKSESGVALSDQWGHRAVFRCPLKNTSCVGSEGKRENGANWQCSKGYGGPLCQECEDGFARKGLQGECFNCDDTFGGGGGGFFLVVLLILVLFASFLFALRFLAKSQAGDKEVRGAVKSINKLQRIIKSCIGLFQVISQLEFTLDLSFPVTFRYFVDFVKIFSLDLLGWLDVGCITVFNYYFKFTFAILLPVALLMGTYATYYITTRKTADPAKVAEEKRVCMQMGFIVIFLLYPSTSQTVFQGFSCRQLAPEEKWLSADYQLSCETLGYNFFQLWGIAFACVWPIGIPVLTLLALLKNRKEMRIKNSPARLKYAFIVTDYKPTFFYWECIDMLRKVMITGLLIFVQKGSVIQVVIAAFISFCFLIALARSFPYKDDLSNKFKLATECSLVLTLILTILLKIDLSKEDISADMIGVVMLGLNVVVPGINLTLGLVKPYFRSFGWLPSADSIDHLFTSEHDEPQDPDGKFDNPLVDEDNSGAVVYDNPVSDVEVEEAESNNRPEPVD